MDGIFQLWCRLLILVVCSRCYDQHWVSMHIFCCDTLQAILFVMRAMPPPLQPLLFFVNIWNGNDSSSPVATHGSSCLLSCSQGLVAISLSISLFVSSLLIRFSLIFINLSLTVYNLMFVYYFITIFICCYNLSKITCVYSILCCFSTFSYFYFSWSCCLILIHKLFLLSKMVYLWDLLVLYDYRFPWVVC